MIISDKLKLQMKMIAATSLAVVTLGAPAVFASTDVTGNNGTTGPNSYNKNYWKINQKVDVKVKNDSKTNNNASVRVETGKNYINHNTTVDGVTSGDVDITGDFVTEVNSQGVDFGFLPSSGDVSADFGNDITGPNSDNKNSLDVKNSTDISVKNSADINNSISATAGTGNNKVNHNTTVGNVTTGDVNIDVSAHNTANANSSSIDLSSLVGSSDVTVSASNGTTGPNSENTNKVDVKNTTKVNLENKSTINNNLNVTSNTGHNNINNNTTVGDVSTGNISVTFGATNTAN